MKAPKRLLVLLYGFTVGEVEEVGSRRFVFRYSDEWREAGPGIPLSISMPLSSAEHSGQPVASYLSGLLPDNERILQAIARDAPYSVSPHNPFALLTYVGEECAGAVQFVVPERRAEATAEGTVEWLDEAGVADVLARARHGLPPRGRADNKGQFSLPGAQPKTALHRDSSRKRVRWGIPSGRTPTTHILKPPIPDLDGQLENEHFCLQLARELGMNAPQSEVLTFGGERAVVVERYDRVPGEDGKYLRVHQEDMCQALGLPPSKKYERDGGPGISRMVFDVLRGSAAARDDVEADVARLLEAITLNWVIAGSDAHAKNFSIIHGPGWRYRLAPLYDINSALPYYDLREVKMPLKVGGQYEMNLQPYHWARLATECRVEPDKLRGTIRRLIADTPDAASGVMARCHASGLSHPVLVKLMDAIAARCSGLRSTYRP